MHTLKAWILILSFLLPGISWAGAMIGAKSGYLESVTEERTERSSEMIFLQKPPPPPGTKPFVSDKLTREFQNQYEIKFGRTNEERNFLPSRYEQYSSGGIFVTYEEDQNRKRNFGNYVLRRMTEYHADNYFKESPNLKPVYEAKDKYSKLDVQVRGGYKAKLNYSLSGNYLDVNIENPYKVESRVKVMFGDQMVYLMGYQFTPTIKSEIQYKDWDGIVVLVTSKRINQHFTTSITASQDHYARGETQQQDLYLFGITWNE